MKYTSFVQGLAASKAEPEFKLKFTNSSINSFCLYNTLPKTPLSGKCPLKKVS